jgi:hypothetical protein
MTGNHLRNACHEINTKVTPANTKASSSQRSQNIAHGFGSVRIFAISALVIAEGAAPRRRVTQLTTAAISMLE